MSVEKIEALTLQDVHRICINHSCSDCPIYNTATGICALQDCEPYYWDYEEWRGVEK